jgi:hypothetical protein
MINAREYLIPEDKLQAAYELIKGRVRQCEPMALNLDQLAPKYQDAYLFYRFFDGASDNNPPLLDGVSELEIFYNAYYWCLVFGGGYQRAFGFDAGIEQQAFRLLESAPEDVDWKTVERLRELAETNW